VALYPSLSFLGCTFRVLHDKDIHIGYVREALINTFIYIYIYIYIIKNLNNIIIIILKFLDEISVNVVYNFMQKNGKKERNINCYQNNN